MMYRTRDGETGFGGRDAMTAIAALRRHSRSPGDSLAAFMLELAERACRQTGARVRADSPDVLIADLIEAGLIVRIM